MNQDLRYSSELWPLIVSGRKTSTIRRNTMLAPGDIATHVNTNGDHINTRVTTVSRINIDKTEYASPIKITVDGMRLTGPQMRELAEMDGFNGAALLLIARIEKLYSLPFDGVLIEWEAPEKQPISQKQTKE